MLFRSAATTGTATCAATGTATWATTCAATGATACAAAGTATWATTPTAGRTRRPRRHHARVGPGRHRAGRRPGAAATAGRSTAATRAGSRPVLTWPGGTLATWRARTGPRPWRGTRRGRAGADTERVVADPRRPGAGLRGLRARRHDLAALVALILVAATLLLRRGRGLLLLGSGLLLCRLLLCRLRSLRTHGLGLHLRRGGLRCRGRRRGTRSHGRLRRGRRRLLRGSRDLLFGGHRLSRCGRGLRLRGAGGRRRLARATVRLRRTCFGVCVPQPAGDRRLDGGGRRLHELTKVFQLGEHILAGYSELLRELVYSGLACHCSPRPSEAGGMDPRDLVLLLDVHGFSFTADS